MRRGRQWLSLLLLVLLLCPGTAMAVVDAPTDVYVGDYANVLSEETEQYMIQQNQGLEQATGAQLVVVTVDFLDGLDIAEYAYQIFNEWGIGDSEKNNGLLLLLAIGEDNYWAVQGKGLEGILSSGELGDYLYNYLEPDFAAKNYDAGVRKVFDALYGWYEEYYHLQSPQSTAAEYGQNTSLDGAPAHVKQGDGGGWLLAVVVILLIILLISLNNRRKDRKRKKNGWPGNGPGGGGGTTVVTRRSIFLPPQTGSWTRNTGRRTFSGGSFGGGRTRGGGAGRSSGGFRGHVGRSGSFGGGRTRGGGAGRR